MEEFAHDICCVVPSPAFEPSVSAMDESKPDVGWFAKPQSLPLSWPRGCPPGITNDWRQNVDGPDNEVSFGDALGLLGQYRRFASSCKRHQKEKNEDYNWTSPDVEDGAPRRVRNDLPRAQRHLGPGNERI